MTNKTDKRIKGLKSNIKGLSFEEKVNNYFSKQGWQTELRKPMLGSEYDIYGEKSELMTKKYLIVECKNKPKLTKSEFVHFASKANKFYLSLPQNYLGVRPSVTAVIAFTGTVDNDIITAAQASIPQIILKQFKI